MSASETQYFQILDTAPDATLVVGRDAKITFVNRQTERLFGHPRAALLGQTFDMLLPARFRGTHAAHFARYFRQPTVRTMGSGMALFGLRADGTELDVEISLSPVETPEGLLVSATIRDTTERRREEKELRHARVAAEAGSAAKSEFLSSMSHELRTPLNAILGFAQLLQRDKNEPLSSRHQERLAQILKGGEHLLHLIDDMLDLSRIEAGGVSISTEPDSVAEVLHEVRSTLEPMAERNGITILIDGPALTVRADRTRFAQMLLNLGSNAIKYNRTNGRVSFTASRMIGGRVRVVVSDTGVGIPGDQQDRIFQPFQRAGQEMGPIEGTGIGLVITKRLAALMGGDVGFRSAAGKGSDFWVELPAEASRSSSPPAPSAVESVSVAGRHLVLYVEDNPANVTLMKDVVSLFDFIDLVSAPTAEKGIEIARTQHPEVIIMDINLPGMSGLVALGVLRDMPETKDIPVIALSAAASAGDKQRGLEAGFRSYLTKPVKIDELLKTLEALFLEH